MQENRKGKSVLPIARDVIDTRTRECRKYSLVGESKIFFEAQP